jgi:hypothetical protein
MAVSDSECILRGSAACYNLFSLELKVIKVGRGAALPTVAMYEGFPVLLILTGSVQWYGWPPCSSSSPQASHSTWPSSAGWLTEHHATGSPFTLTVIGIGGLYK